MTTPLFAPTSFWNTKLQDNHPLITEGGYAQKLINQLHYTKTSTPIAGWFAAGYQVVLNFGAWSTAIYTVPANQPTQKVTWLTNSGRGPAATEDQQSGLQSHFDAVPVPVVDSSVDLTIQNATNSNTDRHVCIYRPSTDEMWECWLWKGSEGAYTFGYGGYLPNVSQHSGVLPNGWGARATGLPLAGGVVRMHEIYDGVIPHALAFSAGDLTLDHIPPATRGDGPATGNPAGSTVNQIQEGSRYRLPASVVIDPTWPPIIQMMARAARDYGMVCVDKTGGTVDIYLEASKSIDVGCSDVTTGPWTTPGPAWSQTPWGSTNPFDKYFPMDQLVQIAYVPDHEVAPVLADPELIGHATPGVSNTTVNAAVTLPDASKWTLGDNDMILLACVNRKYDNAFTLPPGYELLARITCGGSGTMAVCMKRATATDVGAAVAAGWTAPLQNVAVACVYSNLQEIDVSKITPSWTSTTAMGLPELDFLASGSDLIVAFYGGWAAAANSGGMGFTAPAGYANEFDAGSSVANGSNVAVGASDTRATTTTQPAASATASVALGGYAVAHIALIPSAAPPPPPAIVVDIGLSDAAKAVLAGKTLTLSGTIDIQGA